MLETLIVLLGDGVSLVGGTRHPCVLNLENMTEDTLSSEFYWDNIVFKVSHYHSAPIDY